MFRIDGKMEVGVDVAGNLQGVVGWEWRRNPKVLCPYSRGTEGDGERGSV